MSIGIYELIDRGGVYLISILTVFVLPACFLLAFIFKYIDLWVTFYCLICAAVILVIDVIWMLIHFNDEPDPKIRDKFDRIRWLDVIHNDPLTSDVTEDDWHKERGDEDWHGL